jgi:hypothetical protein
MRDFCVGPLSHWRASSGRVSQSGFNHITIQNLSPIQSAPVGTPFKTCITIEAEICGFGCETDSFGTRYHLTVFHMKKTHLFDELNVTLFLLKV